MRRSIVLPQYYELRECGRCVDGRIYEAVGPTEEPRLVSSTSCAGTGRVSVYLYPKPRQRRGRS